MSVCGSVVCGVEAVYSSEDTEMLNRILMKDKPVTDVVNSYNHWLRVVLQTQMDASPLYFTGSDRKTKVLRLKIGDISGPRYNDGTKMRKLYAYDAIQNKLSMMSRVWVTYEITEENGTTIVDKECKRPFFEIPVMKGSKLDHASNERLTKRQLIGFGENLADPGGYFIHKGVRYSIPSLEKLRINQVQVSAACKNFIYRHSRQTMSVPSGTAVVKVCYLDNVQSCVFTTNILKAPSEEEIAENKNNAYLVKEFRYLSVVHILRLLSHFHHIDDEFKRDPLIYCRTLILSMTREEDRVRMNVALSSTFVHGAVESLATTVANLIKWLGVGPGGNVVNTVDQKSKCVRDYITEHVFYSCKTALSKARMVCYMVWRLLSNVCNIPGHNLTSKNDWGNKRLDLCSVLLSQNFRKAYHSVTQAISKNISLSTESNIDTILKLLTDKSQAITDSILNPFKGNSKKNVGTRKSFELAQNIKFHNMVDLYCILTKINVDVDKGTKQRIVRAVQPTQISRVCTTDTPDDSGCGIIKHTSIGAFTTSGETGDDALVLAVKSTGLLMDEYSVEYPVLVQINHYAAVGWCSGVEAYVQLIKYRNGSPARCEQPLVTSDSVYLTTYIKDRGVDTYLACRDNIVSNWGGYFDERGLRLYVNNKELLDANDVPIRVNINFANDYSRWSSILRKISTNTCISLTTIGTLQIYSDAGRVMRPVYVADRTLYDEDAVLIDRYNARHLDVADLFENGFLSYIDAYEEISDHLVVPHSIADAKKKQEKLEDMKRLVLTEGNEAKVKYYERMIANRQVQRIRYVGIHGLTQFGVSVGTSPYVNHNPFSRNTFASKTKKQTMTSPYVWYEHREGKYSLSTTVPLVDSPLLSSVYGLHTFTQGAPAVIAVYTLKDNQEDAIIMSQSYADNQVYITTYVYDVEINKADVNYIQELKHPSLLGIKLPSKMEKYRFIGDNGLPMVGSYLMEGDCILSVCSKARKPTGTTNVDNNTLGTEFVRKGEEGVVKSIISRPVIRVRSGAKDSTVTRYSVLLTRTRRIKNGDKISTGQGQKATVYVVRDVDMPRTISGVGIDAIMNSHAFPSRLTVSFQIEMMLGKAAALRGGLFKSTSFEKPEIDLAEKILHDNGYSSRGTEMLFSGTTGRMYQSEVFVGVVQLQELVHKSQDKEQSRGTSGPTDPITRQPKKGRIEGAARMGELEKNAIVGHGAKLFALERFKTLSDNHVEYVCTVCYKKVFDSAQRSCPYCSAKNSIRYINTTYAYNILRHYLLGTNIRLYTEVRKLTDVLDDMCVNAARNFDYSEGQDMSVLVSEENLEDLNREVNPTDEGDMWAEEVDDYETFDI